MRSFGVTLVVFVLAGCGESPTQPGPTETERTPLVASNAGVPVEPPPPTTIAGSTGILYAEPAPSTETQWCASISNPTPVDQWAVSVCYEDPDRDVATQRLFGDPKPLKVRPGERLASCANKPCGAWQCDAVNSRELPPKNSPYFGQNLLLGRIGTNRDSSCSPPPPPPTCEGAQCEPPPPPCDHEQLGEDAFLECEHGVKSLNYIACTFECAPPPPTCNELNPPKVTLVGGCYGFSGTKRHVTAAVEVCNADVTLRLRAQQGSSKWIKDTEPAKVDCLSECQMFMLSYGPTTAHRATVDWWVTSDGETVGTLPKCQ